MAYDLVRLEEVASVCALFSILVLVLLHAQSGLDSFLASRWCCPFLLIRQGLQPAAGELEPFLGA